MSPALRRRAVDRLVKRGYSKSRACRVCGISRASSRRKPVERNPELLAEVLRLAHLHPRFGFRRIHHLLPGVNIKAVHRIWKQEGLRLRTRKRRKIFRTKCTLPQLTAPNQSWCLDFCHERLQNGRCVRILSVLDCFTRENLLLKAAGSFPASEVSRELEWLFLVYGKPERIISDNGPEFRAMKLPTGIERAFIQPGKPWQNGYVESFFSRLRDEVLNCELFQRGSDLQERLNNFNEYYNDERPHLGLGGKTPRAFKQQHQEQQLEEKILTL